MPDPYGITQVDIPGVYGAVQTAHMNRIQQMLGERQVQAADRQANRENDITRARLAIFGQLAGRQGTSGGAAGTTAPASPSPSPADAVTASYGLAPAAAPSVTPAGLPGANPAGTPAPAAGPMRIDPNSPEARNLIMADPEHGEALIHGINAASDEQVAQTQQRLTRLAPLYIQAAHIPYGTDGSARRAFIQSVLPQLQQLGIDPQQAMSWDPTDQNLNAHISLGQTVSDAAQSVAPHLMVAPMNSDVIDPSQIDPATGRPRVAYQSGFVGTPERPMVRPDTMRVPGPPVTAEMLQAQAADAIRQGAPEAQVHALLQRQLRALAAGQGGGEAPSLQPGAPLTLVPSRGGAAQPQASGTFP